MNYLLPQGIGDAIWAITKLQGFAQYFNDPEINVKLACFSANPEELRAMDFVSRFSFIKSVSPYIMESLFGRNGPVLMPGALSTPEGYFNYIPSGYPNLSPGSMKDIDFVLIPNSHLERGKNLEDWFPDIPIHWDIMSDFYFSPEEQKFGKNLKEQLGNYIVFFMGNISCNSYGGHNRNALWTPEEWIELGEKLINQNLKIVVVGANSDKDYYDTLIKPYIKTPSKWIDFVGGKSIGETYAITSNSKFVISYQSGIGIVSNYLNVPVGIFWRPKGNSLFNDSYVSFEESMAHAWAPPHMRKTKHLPLIYGRHGVNYILEKIDELKWLS